MYVYCIVDRRVYSVKNLLGRGVCMYNVCIVWQREEHGVYQSAVYPAGCAGQTRDQDTVTSPL